MIYRGVVTRVEANGVFLRIPVLGGKDFEFGPCTFPDFIVTVDQPVICGSVSTVMEDITILAAAQDTATPEPDPAFIDSITDTTTIDLAVTGAALSASVKANSIPLNDLSDVVITTPASGHLVKYNGANFVNATEALDDLSDVTASGSATGKFLRKSSGDWTAQDAALDDLSDVTISAPAIAHHIRHNGTTWVNSLPTLDDSSDVDLTGQTDGKFLRRASGVWVPATASLDDLSDVTISSPASGDLVVYNGSAWVNTPNLGHQLFTTTLGGTAANIDITSIPATYSSLEILLMARCDRASQFDGVRVRMNGDTAGNYDSEQIGGVGSTASAFEALSSTGGDVGETPGTTVVAGSCSIHRMTLLAYKGTTFWKHMVSQHMMSAQTSGGAAGAIYSKQWGVRWRSTSAVNQLTFYMANGSNFIAGTTLQLYGRP